MTTPSRSRKERQEKSDEPSASYDSGYASQPGGAKTDTIWFPTNPHNLSLEPYHDRVMLGAGEVIPLKPVRSFAIESTHQIVPHWPTIRAQLHGVFQELGFQWSSLRILHRRQTMAPREGLDDTTLVMAADKAYWGETPQTVLEDCFKIVKSITGSEIWIELINDRAKRSANEDDEDIEPERFSHNVKPLPGSSIGVRDLDWSSGTLGGYMELVDGKGGRIPCCLTNHHVLRPSRINPPPESEAKPKYDEELNIAGKLHEAVNQPKRPLTVDAPAMIDKARTLKYIRSYIERLEKKYGFYEAKATTGIERDVQRFAECKATLEGLKKEELRIENFDLSLGTLVASSGYRRSSRTRGALDWAIVTLNKDRVGQNSVSCPYHNTPPPLCNKRLISCASSSRQGTRRLSHKAGSHLLGPLWLCRALVKESTASILPSSKI